MPDRSPNRFNNAGPVDAKTGHYHIEPLYCSFRGWSFIEMNLSDTGAQTKILFLRGFLYALF